MKTDKKLILFALPGNEDLTEKIASQVAAEIGKTEIRLFPDGESYVRVLSDVKDKYVVLICTLNQPNEKFLPLYFLSKAVKKQGANHVSLVAPYLAYMRQDKVFNRGESVTSHCFGEIVSAFVDSIITVDPHLHRRKSISEIYPIPNEVVHATNHIAAWITMNVENPVLIGPDGESEQWVSEVAFKAKVPYTVLQKVRSGDRNVEVSVPQIDEYKNHTPVLVDDIISTARTMIETAKHLKKLEMKPPICIGVHAVFASSAMPDLLSAGVKKVVTCNTIPHLCNDIDISDLFTDFINNLG